MKRFVSFCAVLLLPGLARAADPVDFMREIKPILAKYCTDCHGAKKQRGGLRLDSAKALLKGGDSGPAILAGDSGRSRLIQAVTHIEGVTAMPPKGRVAPDDIGLLIAWVDGGAKAPEEKPDGSTRKSKHWAFQPIVRAAGPPVKDRAWARNPIDRFILARLEKDDIKPSAEADRVTLIRRLSLDLIGLPPTPQEVDDFVNDKRADAYERVVERLLASTHYGERWGRHWLDRARYADSNGYSIDAPRSIWKYRDWVIDAFNKDKPFDQFSIEQLAGDLLPSATVDQRIATGFHRNTQINQEGGIDVEQFRVESIVDRVNTTGSVFLGLTIGCCQCHDHKFDPIAQREYYQLFAFFNNADEPTIELPTPEQERQRKTVRAKIAELEKKLKQLDATTPERLAEWEGHLNAEAREKLPAAIQKILAIAPNGRNARQEQALMAYFRQIDQVRQALGGLANPLPLVTAAHLNALTIRRSLESEIATLKRKDPVIATTLVVQERKTPRTTYIMLGGDFLRKGATVTPGVPSVLPPLTKEKPNRLDLARWLFDPRNPLTARVAVNRVWQAYFGTGLVETENDFGTQGATPTHPELLDWLASEFIARKWSLKDLHRLIVTSATYRQSSKVRPDLSTVDPRNRMLARQNRLRLDAEIVRDIALASSGLLSSKIGGPSVYPPQPSGVYSFTQVPREWKPSTGEDRYRRGMYTFFWRSAPHPGLTVFDAPDAGSTCTRRNRSNTPLQALTLLNDQSFIEFAQGLVQRVLKDGKATDEERLETAFRLCLARRPSARERTVLSRLLERQCEAFVKTPSEAKALLPTPAPKNIDPARFAAWTMVARALLNLDEFITRE
jgi:hypothetical protein